MGTDDAAWREQHPPHRPAGMSDELFADLRARARGIADSAGRMSARQRQIVRDALSGR